MEDIKMEHWTAEEYKNYTNKSAKKTKYRSYKTSVDGHTFDSLKEANYYNGLKLNDAFDTLSEKEYIEYKSYNIDLINMRDLSYDEILNKFGVTSDDLSFFMKNKFLNYYADLLDKGYLDGTKCDFNCFLVNCNFQDLDEDNVLYIKKNHLYLYKFFNIYTDYNYNEYFSYDDFVFNVK